MVRHLASTAAHRTRGVDNQTLDASGWKNTSPTRKQSYFKKKKPYIRQDSKSKYQYTDIKKTKKLK